MNTQLAQAPLSTRGDVAEVKLVWDTASCTQCNNCVAVCPHEAIRAHLFDPEDPGHMFAVSRSAKPRAAKHKGLRYTIEISHDDCTRCGVCVEVCPASNDKNGRLKALDMSMQVTVPGGGLEKDGVLRGVARDETQGLRRNEHPQLVHMARRVGEPASPGQAGYETLATLFGVPVNALSNDQVLSIVDRVISCRGRLLIGVVNAAKMVNMLRDDSLRDAVLSSDVILADGMAVVWATRLLRKKLPERVPGIDLMHRILRRGDQRQYRVYLLGATEDVLRVSAARIEAEYPGVVLVGARNGYFDSKEEPGIVAEIRAARPDVLFVAMSPPKKELFMARWFAELEVPVCHGVGGALDVLAGKVQRAPERWQRLGLEWLYRVKQEPRRMWRRYLVTNTLFCGMVLREFCGWGWKKRGTPNVSGLSLSRRRDGLQRQRSRRVETLVSDGRLINTSGKPADKTPIAAEVTGYDGREEAGE